MNDKSEPDKTFTDGYIEGWQSIRPGEVPAIPAHSIPAGKTPYQHGLDLGEEAAIEFNQGRGKPAKASAARPKAAPKGAR
jgi:hypothetical protein